jgi:type IV pilus assembly protein PilB
MGAEEAKSAAGEALVKNELITREELDRAKAREASTGTPWYKQLVQSRLVSFQAIEEVLRYEFHPKALREEHHTLGHTLVDMGAISEEQLVAALAEQKRNGRLLGALLLERGLVTHEVIGRALARQHAMEYAELATTPSQPAALEAVHESVALRNEVLPVALEGDRLTLLMTSPQNQGRLHNLSVLLGKRIHPMLTASEDFREAITARYHAIQAAAPAPAAKQAATPEEPAARKGAAEAPSKAPSKKSATKKDTPMAAVEPEPQGARESSRFDDIARQASGASVVKMVQTILEGAINSAATDVHLDPQDPEMRVRYRIDGILHDVMSIPEALEQAVVSRIKILADLDITETRRPQDGHIRMEMGEDDFDIRVATLPCYLGERVVMRLLDQSSILHGIKDLGLEPDDEKKLTRVIEQPYGMVLVTGPTGSGKTTTLYACLNQKNVMTDSIVTLEDPVEYQLSGINQVQIDTDIGVTFATTLRAALRQDIDVLLVGEIRDAETARIAIRAAMTGHLVFSTLHTNDAPEAIGTLRNMEVPTYLISSALTAVIGQRLVRTICPNCRTSYKPSAALLKSLGLPASTTKLYRGKGCDLCYHTGNRGRTGIFELLEITPAVRELIAADAPVEKIHKAAKLKTMAMRCRERLVRGEVDAEEFLRVIRT